MSSSAAKAMRTVAPVRVDETLWASSMAPEGMLLAWATPHGARVTQGDRVAEVMIEGARHEILAPASGFLHQEVDLRFVLQPGDEIGRILDV